MKHVYYVVILILRPQGDSFQLLLALRAEAKYMGNTWQLISGGIEPNETAWQAAIREMAEESGLKPRELYRLSTLTSFYGVNNDSLNTAPMFCALVAEDAAVRLNDEHTDFTWVDIEEVESRLMWPSDRQALAEVRSVIIGNGIAKDYMRIPLETLR